MSFSSIAFIIATAGTVAATLATPAAAAPVGTPVQIVNSLDSDPATADGFTSTLEGCESGTAENGRVSANFTPWGGTFSGEKVFLCADGESGFVVQLSARFGEAGSVGTWTVVDSWGSVEGLNASGRLTGVPTSTGLDDIYTGTRRR